MKPPEAERGAGVHIAILDTAPNLHDLIEAYDYWHEDRHGLHPLAERLLRPNGPLRVYPATLEELRLTADYSIVGHRYEMADHGLFIAGIIHTIAQQANLHLYEVFDPYGMGCIETIARGLVKVLDLRDELIRSGDPYRLVVNCSFVLGVTRDGQMDPGLPAQLQDPNLLAEMQITFNEIIEALNQKDVVVVAAAGNDAKAKTGGGVRPPARFPAASPSVTGVGAMPRDNPVVSSASGLFGTASYSNLADDPNRIGFVTLGGEAGVEKGVQGIYIGRFPRNIGPYPENDPRITPAHIRYDPNEEGWAWWSGTSFATPIVSGLLAAWWGFDLTKTANDARAFLDTSAPGRTADKEKVILVDQA